MTSLADLKGAIARVEEYRAMPLTVQLHSGVGFAAAERDAWRTAFEWAQSVSKRFVTALDRHQEQDGSAVFAEHDEGMRLIEKLR